MKRPLVLLAALLTLGLGACETEPGLNFLFEDNALAEIPTPGTVPTDSVGDYGFGILRVARNGVVLPCFNDQLRGQGSRDGFKLTLTVTRQAQSPCTNDQDRAHRYIAYYGNLRGGNYNIRVFENLNGTQTLVKDTTVTID